MPQECLILTMRQNQKYFPLFDARRGTAAARFLIVSNMEVDDPRHIVAGNERVVRARLADAQFFFDQDRKTRLADRVRAAGAQWSITTSSAASSSGCSASRSWPARSRRSCAPSGEGRARGVAGQGGPAHRHGGRVPRAAGRDGPILRAARRRGRRRWPTRSRRTTGRASPGDTLPEDNIGCAVALADKLDTLVGIFGIGLAPTGDKDPFGLRRQALGVLRILSEKSLPLDLVELLQLAKLSFAPGVVHDSVAVDLHAFILERLRNYLRERDFAPDEIEAVVSQNPTRIDQVVPRLEAVKSFRTLPEAQSLASANKRIRNILKKTTVSQNKPDPTILQEAAEKDLTRLHRC